MPFALPPLGVYGRQDHEEQHLGVAERAVLPHISHVL
jgi:hypothetical protein